MTGRHTTEAFLRFRCLDTFASVLALFAAFALATWRQVRSFHNPRHCSCLSCFGEFGCLIASKVAHGRRAAWLQVWSVSELSVTPSATLPPGRRFLTICCLVAVEFPALDCLFSLTVMGPGATTEIATKPRAQSRCTAVSMPRTRN